MNLPRVLAGAAFAAAALTIAARSPSPALLAPFLGVLILPLAAALAWSRALAAVPFLAGAIYALAAGAQRLYYPDGDTAFVNQISTFALCALWIAVAARLIGWVAVLVRRRKHQ